MKFLKIVLLGLSLFVGESCFCSQQKENVVLAAEEFTKKIYSAAKRSKSHYDDCWKHHTKCPQCSEPPFKISAKMKIEEHILLIDVSVLYDASIELHYFLEAEGTNLPLGSLKVSFPGGQYWYTYSFSSLGITIDNSFAFSVSTEGKTIYKPKNNSEELFREIQDATFDAAKYLRIIHLGKIFLQSKSKNQDWMRKLIELKSKT